MNRFVRTARRGCPVELLEYRVLLSAVGCANLPKTHAGL